MLRTMLTAASVLALAGAAWAQDQTQSEELPVGTPEYTQETMPETAPAESMPAETGAMESTAPDLTLVSTKDDLKTYSDAEFQLADANADGALDEAEFSSYANMHILADAGITSDEGVVGEGDIDTEAGVSGATAESLFADLSAGKETVSKDELLAARTADFDEADANDDDQLDETEKLQFAALVKGEAPAQ